jgi:hypothetical protein
MMELRTKFLTAALALVAVASPCFAQTGPPAAVSPWWRLSSPRAPSPHGPTPCTEMRPIFVPAISEHGLYQPARTEYDPSGVENCDESKRKGWKCTCTEFKFLSCAFLTEHHYNACAPGESLREVRVIEHFNGACAESPGVGPKVNVDITAGPEIGHSVCVAPKDLLEGSETP